jgi:hypothetical protein
MNRIAVLVVLAALSACGPVQDDYGYGSAQGGYGHRYYDRPSWGTDYQPGPVYRGHARGGDGHRGGGQGDQARSRQFWGTDRAERTGAARRDPGGFWGGGQRAAAPGPRGGGGAGDGRRERRRSGEGEN